MTRRRFLFSPAVAAKTAGVMNKVATTGGEADKAFLAWAQRWNALVMAIMHTVPAPGTELKEAAAESSAWEEYMARFQALRDAHDDYVKGK